MGERPAVDASPLIFLTKAGRLDYLQFIAEEIVVPAAVAAEIRSRGATDPTVRAVASASWLKVVESPPVSPRLQRWDLGPGESEVLAWCLSNPGAEAIIDDLSARNFAAAYGIPVRGTLGLVLIAKQRGRIESARPILEEMRQAGMWLSDAVLNRALRRVGE